MFLLFIIFLVEGRQYESCKANMDSFQIKGIHFCVSDHFKEARNQVLQDSVSQNKVKAIVQEIENLENQNPFLYQELTLYLNIDEIHITGNLDNLSQNFSIVNQHVRISKHVYFKNLISKELMITNVFSSSPLLRVDFEKLVLPSNATTQRTKVFTVVYEQPLAEIRSKTFEIWLAVEIAYFLRVPIKLIVYDKHLMCQNKLIGQCSLQGQHSTIDYGNIGINQQYTQKFAFFNPNPVSIEVNYKQQERKKNQIRVFLVRKEDLKSAAKRKFYFEIPPFTRVELQAIINTNHYQILAETRLIFRTQFEYIDLSVTYSVQKGSLNIYPSIITLDPGQNNKVQIIDMYARSTFNQPIQLLQIGNQFIKQQNISLLTMTTIIPQNSKQEILHIDYFGKNNFNSESRYHKQQAKELLNSFGKNKIKIQTDVQQDLEVIVNYKTSFKNIENTQKKINKPELQQQQQKIIISNQPNAFLVIISILNMFYIASLLRSSNIKNKQLKIVIKNTLIQEQSDFQNLFKQQQEPQLPVSKSETNEVVSERTDEIQDIIDIQQEELLKESVVLTNMQSQIEESSSHFSQGESVDEDQMSEYQEKRVVSQPKIVHQKNFNLFHRVEFTIPTQYTQNTQSSQECWDTKDPIFLPHDSDEEMLDQNSVQKLEQLQSQIQHRLPQLEQSTLRLPLRWNENNQFNPYFPRPPPGI